jgi:transcriptional regulator with XRE-family HTH domain
VLRNRQRGERPPHFLRAWRKERRLTQPQLGERAGAHHSVISKIENGEIRLTEHRIVTLAAALRISAGDLFRDPADRTGAWAIANMIAGLPTETVETILRLIEALAPERRER